MPLRLRLALLGTGVVVAAFAVFGFLLFALGAGSARNDQDTAIRQRAQAAARSLAGSDPVPRGLVAPVDLRTSSELFVEGLDAGGTPVFSTGAVDGAAVSVPASLLGRGGFATIGSGPTQLRVFVMPAAAGPVAYVLAGQASRVLASNRGGLLFVIVASGIPTLLAALGASWLVAGRALRPLERAAAAAAEIGVSRDFGRRLAEPRRRDEVAVLASSFNWMGRLVDQLLTLARTDAGVEPDRRRLDVEAIVREVARQAAAAHPERAFTVEACAAEIGADPDAIRQVLWILVENACRHSRPGGPVRIRLWVEPGWARIEVADSGPGITPAALERVFERFHRADAARSGGGTGLGLAIARGHVGAHGGRVIAGANAAGGASFYVDLPLLPPS